MKSNLSQHPCANKCTEFKDEQCKTCLVRDIEKREFDLGVAPDDAYVKNQKYLKGDVVVYLNHIKFDDLEVVEAYQPSNQDFLVGDVVVADFSNDLLDIKYVYPTGKIRITDGLSGRTVTPEEIRHATVAELKAKRRLTASELSIAEVS